MLFESGNSEGKKKNYELTEIMFLKVFLTIIRLLQNIKCILTVVWNININLRILFMQMDQKCLKW